MNASPFPADPQAAIISAYLKQLKLPAIAQKGPQCYPTAACPPVPSSCGRSRHSQCCPTKQRYGT